MTEKELKNTVRGLLFVSLLSLLVYLLSSADFIPRLDGGLPPEIVSFDEKQKLFSSELTLNEAYFLLGLMVVAVCSIYGLGWFMRREGVYIWFLLVLAFLPVGGLGYVNFETNYTQFLSDLSDVTFYIAAVLIFLKKKLIKE